MFTSEGNMTSKKVNIVEIVSIDSLWTKIMNIFKKLFKLTMKIVKLIQNTQNYTINLYKYDRIGELSWTQLNLNIISFNLRANHKSKYLHPNHADFGIIDRSDSNCHSNFGYVFKVNFIISFENTRN